MGCWRNRYVVALFNFFKYGLIFMIIPPILNYAALKREEPVMKTHGLYYDVGFGQKLFFSCKGNGTPTIITESPIGISSDIWLNLQEKLSKLTKVCVYDRAGLGMSDRPVELPSNATDESQNRVKRNRGQEFTLERMVEDLRRLITTSSTQERPIMFVASEFGSLIARFYAQIYETDVSHLVMVNPMIENIFDVNNAIWKHHWYHHVIPKWNELAIGSLFGINRILLMLNFIETQLGFSEYPEEIVNRQKHLMCSPKNMYSILDEYYYLNESFPQMKLVHSIKQFPKNVSITVIANEDTAPYNTENSDVLKKAWFENREQLVKHLYPNSVYKQIDKETSRKLYSDPQYLYGICEELILNWRKANRPNKVTMNVKQK